MIPRFFNHYKLWIELIYSLVVILSCFLIYIKTKELYDLTSYKGVKYFRNTFLFFGITYFVRFILHLVFISRIDRVFFKSIGLFEIAFFIMSYSSTMALIYLIYSVFWKELNNKFFSNIKYFNLIALIMAFISIIIRVPLAIFIFQAFIILLLIIIGYSLYKKKKHKGNLSQLYLVYVLIFILWIVSNILEFITYFSPAIGLIVYALSILSFVIILLKVFRKLNYS